MTVPIQSDDTEGNTKFHPKSFEESSNLWLNESLEVQNV